MSENITLKNKINAFFITVVTMFVLVPITNFLIDPTGVFFNRDRVLERNSSMSLTTMKLIISGGTGCNDFVFGTSKILSWDTTYLPNQPCKLAYPGKGLQSFIRSIKIMLDSGIEINSIIINLERDMFFNQDHFTYKNSAPMGLDYPYTLSEKYFALKTLLYANTDTNIKSFFSPTTAEETWKIDFQKPSEQVFRQLKYRWENGKKHIKFKNREDHADAINNIPAYWGISLYSNYEPAPTVELLKDIEGLARKNDFTLIYIRPPMFLKNIVLTEKTAFFDTYKQLLKISPFYDFSYDIEYLKNPRLWIDYVHYRREVAKRITDDLIKEPDEMEFGRLITEENIDAHLAEFENNIYKYFINDKPNPPNTVIHESWLD